MEIDVLEVLKEVKEVLMEFDPRLNGMCYNPGSEDCECTLCKIDKLKTSTTKWNQSDGDTKCQQCHSPNPLWTCDNYLFNQINESPNGILCPICFYKKAESKGINIIFEARTI